MPRGGERLHQRSLGWGRAQPEVRPHASREGRLQVCRGERRPRRGRRRPRPASPSRTIWPSRMTTTRPNVSATNRMSWLIARTVRPSPASRRTISRTTVAPRRSCPVVGSSRTMIGVRIARTDAIASSFRRAVAEVVRDRVDGVGEAHGREGIRDGAVQVARRAGRGSAARRRPRPGPGRRRSGGPGPGRRGPTMAASRATRRAGDVAAVDQDASPRSVEAAR